MRELVAVARRQGERVSTEKLLSRAALWTSQPFADRLRRIVVDGDTVELDAAISQPCLALENTEKPQFDIGFDFDEARKSHRVGTVRADSSAFAAGLRTGQRLVRWSVHSGDVTKPVELAVADDGGERTIRYLPHGSKISVPRFVVGQQEACKDRL